MKETGKNKKIKKENKGITGIDLVIAITVVAIFTGVIANAMYNAYLQAIEIQKAANADAYATIILEKIDEKGYEAINNTNPNQFVANLKNNGEIAIDTNYTINLAAQEIKESLIKKITLTTSYQVNNTARQLTITKIKVREK